MKRKSIILFLLVFIYEFIQPKLPCNRNRKFFNLSIYFLSKNTFKLKFTFELKSLKYKTIRPHQPLNTLKTKQNLHSIKKNI